MNTDRCRFPSIVLAGALLALAGCSGGEPAEPTGAASTDPVVETREARTLPIPGVDRPAGEGSSGELRWDVPGDWIVETPASGMRFAQYRVPGPSGDGECVVFYFGPGEGGDPMANAVRWAGMFTQPDGSSSVDRMQIDNVDSRSGPVRIVEVTGTYDGGMTMTAAPAESRPDHMLLGGIAQGPDAPWFFKFTGPEQTVRAQRGAFVEMMRSIGTAD